MIVKVNVIVKVNALEPWLYLSVFVRAGDEPFVTVWQQPLVDDINMLY
jgi:hypothetical protein